jgi:hypothetical protein
MNLLCDVAICDVATQCFAVEKMLSQLKARVYTSRETSLLETAIHSLDAYALELCAWTGKHGEPAKVSFYVWKERDTLIELCKLRMDLLEESLKEALTTPLPNMLRYQLSVYLRDFTTTRAALEATFGKVAETHLDVFHSGILKNSGLERAFVRA